MTSHSQHSIGRVGIYCGMLLLNVMGLCIFMVCRLRTEPIFQATGQVLEEAVYVQWWSNVVVIDTMCGTILGFIFLLVTEIRHRASLPDLTAAKDHPTSDAKRE